MIKMTKTTNDDKEDDYDDDDKDDDDELMMTWYWMHPIVCVAARSAWGARAATTNGAMCWWNTQRMFLISPTEIPSARKADGAWYGTNSAGSIYTPRTRLTNSCASSDNWNCQSVVSKRRCCWVQLRLHWFLTMQLYCHLDSGVNIFILFASRVPGSEDCINEPILDEFQRTSPEAIPTSVYNPYNLLCRPTGTVSEFGLTLRDTPCSRFSLNACSILTISTVLYGILVNSDEDE